MQTTYKTSELELASFLKTRGHKLVAAKPQGRIVEFAFDGNAAGDLDPTSQERRCQRESYSRPTAVCGR